MECPKLKKCPIYIENVLSNEITKQTYRNLYCLRGEKYSTCKRYVVSNMVNKPVPNNILPNSSLSVEEIINKYF